MKSRRRSLLAWSVPFAAVLSVIAVSAAPHLLPAGADPVPNLPQLTPAELLVKVRTANVPTFSGDVKLTANLGLPDLGSLGSFGAGGTGSVLDYLSGTHTAQVWADGPQHLRLAVPVTGAESDWIRNGSDLWAWDSRNQSVTHATVPADAPGPTPADQPAEVPLTPAELAQQILAKVDPSTTVSVETPGYVAGRPVYELVLAPKSSASTVGTVTVSVDAATGAPLDTAITARGASSPAIELGFTSISFDQPASSVFAFTPPPGATVTEASAPTELIGLGGQPGDLGEHRRPKTADGSTAPTVRTPADTTPAAGPKETAKVVGTDWSSVAVISGASLGGEVQSILGNARAVTGPAGSGRLISTPLINVLVLDDGRIAVGAVTPETLQAAVAGS
jgi:outer membrane lipoprotein-sorting protein